MKSKLLLLLFTLGLFACENTEETTAFQLTEIPVPSTAGGEPNLTISATGQPYLSWVEYVNDTTDALQFSLLENGKWTAPRTVAQGSDWFVNWADFPSLAIFQNNENYLAAHWLQKSAAGTYDYDVHIALSHDGGTVWAPSFIPHRDSIAAEHGFVSLLPLANGRMFAVWLDGRNTKKSPQSTVHSFERSENPELASGQQSEEEHGGHGHGHGGPMTLRTATFDAQGNLADEAELDDRICDCCQTAAALTSDGPIVAYRDRSETEVRDISVVRQVNGQWTQPMTIGSDNWEISACPVNGPALAADGQRVALAWFTAAGGQGKVQVAISEDAGKTFGDPTRIDDGNPSGRVDVIFTKNETLVSWLENTDEGADIRIARVSPNGSRREVGTRFGDSQTLVQTSPSRTSGFPRLAFAEGKIYLAWTAVEGEATRVKAGVVE